MADNQKPNMKLELRGDLEGYAIAKLRQNLSDRIDIVKPFVFLTGPNGSGKSAVLRGIRASIGIQGERGGKLKSSQQDIDPERAGNDLSLLAGYIDNGQEIAAGNHVPALFDPKALGWKGHATYLFDSRAASTIASRSDFSDDMEYHISLIVGGGGKVSHGEFVKKTWWEAVEWALGTTNVSNPWSSHISSPARKAFLEQILENKTVRSDRGKSDLAKYKDKAKLSGLDVPEEKWLFIDEPETAIDVETLLVGIAVLLEAAEIGKLRVFCASHSLLFPAGLARHPKVQTINLGADLEWMKTQEIALNVSGDADKLRSVGLNLIKRIKNQENSREN